MSWKLQEQDNRSFLAFCHPCQNIVVGMFLLCNFKLLLLIVCLGQLLCFVTKMYLFVKKAFSELEVCLPGEKNYFV